MGRIRSKFNATTLIKNFKYLLQEPFVGKNKTNLEIGMGKGDFLIKQASLNKNIDFVGIEKEATIVWKALKKITSFNEELKNIFVINDRVECILNWIKKNSLSKIYINFPDPWPKKRHIKNRIINQEFLSIYQELLIDNGTIEFKTDNEYLYTYFIDVLKSQKVFKVLYKTNDLYADAEMLVNNIPTEYEKKFIEQNKKIHKIIGSKVI